MSAERKKEALRCTAARLPKMDAPEAVERFQKAKGLKRTGIADPATLEAINATIGGCGVQCLVEETERYGTVRVSFPSVAGIPEQFERKRIIIEEIIPCHLEIDYFFRFMTWAICESKGYTWGRVEKESHNWGTFALAVN